MASSEERMKILSMLQQGTISASEAGQLLEALEEIKQPAAGTVRGVPATAAANKPAPHWLRVRVTDTDTGKTRVNIRLPLSLVSSGMKMGMRFSPEVEGLDTEELMKMIANSEIGQVVDVYDEEDGEHVEVFVE